MEALASQAAELTHKPSSPVVGLFVVHVAVGDGVLDDAPVEGVRSHTRCMLTCSWPLCRTRGSG